MTDAISVERRSANMRAIRSSSTKPEMTVRRTAYALGYRFRLHRKDLVGRPDLVFSGQRKAIFVHGCFWHQHNGCQDGRLPKSNLTYWKPKLKGNVQRDAEHISKLKADGWKVLVIWECQVQDTRQLYSRLSRFLGGFNGKTD